MRTFPDIRMRQLVSDAQRAQGLFDESRYAEAKELFTATRARAQKLGVDSAYLAWGVAVSTDCTDEPEVAFKMIQQSIALDPFNPATQSSFNAITWRLRNALTDPDRALDDPSTPRIYRLLLEAGEADVASHVVMARHLAHAGDHAEALALLDAVTLLAPVSRDAWLAKAAVAHALGDAALAAECDAQAAALGTKDVPFGIPAAAGASC